MGDDPATDTAVLRLPGGALPHAELGASAALRIGRLVVATGNPLGFTCTVTAGSRRAKRGSRRLLEDAWITPQTLRHVPAGGPARRGIGTDAAAPIGPSIFAENKAEA